MFALQVCPLSASEGFLFFSEVLELFARFLGIKDGNWCGVASFQILVALSTGMATRVDKVGALNGMLLHFFFWFTDLEFMFRLLLQMLFKSSVTTFESK